MSPTTDRGKPLVLPLEGAAAHRTIEQTLQHVIQFLRREAATLLAASSCAVASAMATGGLALSLGELAAALPAQEASSSESARFFVATLTLALVLLARATTQRIGSWLAERAAERNVARLRTHVHTRILRLPLDALHRHGTTRLGTRIGQESLAARPVLGPLWVNAVAQGASLLALLGVAMTTWPAAALLGALALPLLAWLAARLSRHTRRAWREAWQAQHQVAAAAAESVAHPAAWRSASAEPWLSLRFARRIERSHHATYLAMRRKYLGSLALYVLALLGLLFAGLWLAWGMGSEALSPTEAARLLAAAALTVPPAAALADTIHGIGAAIAPFARLMELSREPSEPPPPDALPMFEGPVSLRGAVVHRGGRAVLQGVSVTVEPGEILAVTGPNGSGKSTLLLTLAGLLPLTEGELRVGEVLVRGELRAAWWRRVGWLGPEPAVLADSIAANVALHPEPDETRVLSALREVGLSQWLEGRGGLDAPLLAEGSDLSSGERRRLDIARALYQGHRFLLFDEPGSHLDEETLCWLKQRIRRWAERGCTIVLSTHDPRLLEAADRVVRLRAGRPETDSNRTHRTSPP